jgi:hypothetical protein
MRGFDKARFPARIVEHSANFSDGDFQHIRTDMDVRPHTLQQFLFTDQLAGSFGEVSKDAKCLWREVERFRAARKATCRQVEMKWWKANTFASGC